MFKPVKQSPVHHRLKAAGGAFVEVAGWLGAAHFGDPAREVEAVQQRVGLCDLSTRSKWRLEGLWLVPYLSGLLGGQIPPPGRVVRYEDSLVCRLSPDEAMFLFDSEKSALIDVVRQRDASESCLHWMDRTSGLAWFLLSGPQARSVLRKLTSLDLRDKVLANLGCAVGPMAAVSVLLLRRDFRDLPAFHILVSREYADYLWDVLVEAGREFQIKPFGREAAQLLGAS